ncbi:hypothetical protein ACOJBO_07885 [Rhizobium beringeri]
MIDPVVCGSMTMGTARVDLAALIELDRLVSGGAKAALFQGEHESLRRKMMRSRNTLVPASDRQLDLIFKTRTLGGLGDRVREKAISALACLLMQAAGLAVEEFNDDQH